MSSTPVLKTRPEPTTLVPQRSLKNIVADAVLEERHEDETEITHHPVEVGATISDHAYERPAELTLTYVWSMSSDQNDDEPHFLNDVYTQIRQLKTEHIPFKVITGKRSYENMLISGLMVNTDKTTENVLLIRIHCLEILMASTQKLILSKELVNHRFPSSTGPVVDVGTVNLIPGDKYNKSGGRQ
jgi:hypothetical protein